MDKRKKRRILLLILLIPILTYAGVYCFTLHQIGEDGFEFKRFTPEDNEASFWTVTEDGWYRTAGGGGQSSYKLHSCVITVKGRIIHGPYRLVFSNEDGTVVFDETFNTGEVNFSKKISFYGSSYQQTEYIKDYSFAGELEVIMVQSSYGYEFVLDALGLYD